MLNVGFLTAHHYPRLGGMEYMTHFLADYLNQRNDVNVAVACNTLRGIPKDFKYPYPCYRSKSLSYLTPWLFKKNQLKMLRKEQINILHGPMLHGGGSWAESLSKQFNLPFVAHSHGSDIQVVNEISYGALLNPVSKKVIRKVIERADKLIAVSNMNKQNLVDFGAKPERVKVIHNGIQINEINEVTYKNKREEWGVNDDDFVIISVGRNRPVKRMELLFKALEKLKDYKRIKCVCVGPKQDLYELASKFGILNKVILTGKIPMQSSLYVDPPYSDLINAYRAANLYVSTSYVESFGSASADALACGIPVIVGSNHGVRDVLIEEKTGWVMKKETPEELAELFLYLYKEKYNLLNTKQDIKESVAHLKWGDIALQTVKLYKTIL